MPSNGKCSNLTKCRPIDDHEWEWWRSSMNLCRILMFWGAGAPSRILPAAHKERNAQHSTWSSSLSVVIMIILVMMMVTINNPSLLLPTCQNHHDAITLCHAVWTVRLITWSAQSCDWFGPPSLKPAQVKSGRIRPQSFAFPDHRWLKRLFLSCVNVINDHDNHKHVHAKMIMIIII